MSNTICREHCLNTKSCTNETCKRWFTCSTRSSQQYNNIYFWLHEHRSNQKILHNIWLAEFVFVKTNFEYFGKSAYRHSNWIILRDEIVFCQMSLNVIKYIIRNVLSLLKFTSLHNLASRPELFFVEFSNYFLESNFDARSKQKQIFFCNL